MDRKILSLVICILSLTAFSALGNQNSRDFSRNSKEYEVLREQDIRDRLQIEGRIFVTDQNGEKVLFEESEYRKWSFYGDPGKLMSHWRYESNETPLFALRHEWDVTPDGKITVLVQQFSDMEKDPNQQGGVITKKLLKEKKIVVNNFSPVIWTAHQLKDRRVVVRLTPSFSYRAPRVKLKNLPLGGKKMNIFDNKGNLWGKKITANGKYIAFITHKGALYLSFTPFFGAKKIGYARGDQIKVRLGSQGKVTIISKTNFVPDGVEGKIYGYYRKDKKTKGPSSVRVMTSGDEKDFLSR